MKGWKKKIYTAEWTWNKMVPGTSYSSITATELPLVLLQIHTYYKRNAY